MVCSAKWKLTWWPEYGFEYIAVFLKAKEKVIFAVTATDSSSHQAVLNNNLATSALPCMGRGLQSQGHRCLSWQDCWSADLPTGVAWGSVYVSIKLWET